MGIWYQHPFIYVLGTTGQPLFLRLLDQLLDLLLESCTEIPSPLRICMHLCRCCRDCSVPSCKATRITVSVGGLSFNDFYGEINWEVLLRECEFAVERMSLVIDPSGSKIEDLGCELEVCRPS